MEKVNVQKKKELEIKYRNKIKEYQNSFFNLFIFLIILVILMIIFKYFSKYGYLGKYKRLNMK